MTTDNKTLAGALTRFRCAGYDPTDGSGPIMVADPDGPWVLATDVIGTSSDCEATPASPDAPESGGDWFGDVLGSIGTVAPLADVQPGGRVRLGDGDEKPPQELPKLIVTRGDGIPLPDQAAGIEEFKRQCLRRIGAEFPHLSAQPSPGGQGDSNGRIDIGSDVVIGGRKAKVIGLDPYTPCLEIEWTDAQGGKEYRPREQMILAARQPVYVQGCDELRARTESERAAYMEGLEEGKKIAARQPVGDLAEPIFQIKHHDDTEATWRDATKSAYEMQPAALRRMVYTTLPAQAVDLGRWSQRHADDLHVAVHTALSVHAGSLSQKKRAAISAYVKRLLIDSQAVGK